MANWHQLEAQDVLETLRVDLGSGLDGGEVERRRSEHGPNELEERGRKPSGACFWIR